jgi:glycosyltransferase involved in cell wall biosynthesis
MGSIKVCCVIHSLGVGGMERVMSLLIQEFVTYSDVEVHLVLIGRERVISFDLPENIFVHKPKWKFKAQKRKYHSLKTLFFIRKTVGLIKPNTILSFGEMWNNLVLLALWGKSYPVFISDRSTPNKNLGRLQNFLRDMLYPRASGYIAQTEKAAYVASFRNWNKNIKIIGNPVPNLEFEKTKNKNVLTVGRLIKTKNVDRLVDIFSQVVHDSEEAKNWRLVVVGGNAPGEYILENLKTHVETQKMSNHVALLGMKNNVFDYLADAMVFAFTSTSEGFPNALAEAMSSGLAVVAYDCMAGPSDLIDDGINGFLVPEHDEKLFKQRLIMLIENEELRNNFGAAAKIKMRRFHQKPIAKKFLDFIMNKR